MINMMEGVATLNSLTRWLAHNSQIQRNVRTLVTNGKTARTYEARTVGYNMDTVSEHDTNTVMQKKTTHLGYEQTTVFKKLPFVAS